jgi:RND superfamily putative drug exporter
MKALTAFVLRHPLAILAAWAALIAPGAVGALRLQGVLQGGTDVIPGSPSHRFIQSMDGAFGEGSFYAFVIVVGHPDIPTSDPRHETAVADLELALRDVPAVRRVFHAFNTRGAEFRGRDGRTSLILVMPAAPDFYHAERLVPILRDAVRSAGLPTGFAAHVTGTPALYHDLDRSASDDLLRAERIGIPLTLAILLVVFGAPLAAALPLVLATAAVTLSLAGLWILSGWMPVGVFAQNAASMIGLGVGVDYALFILSRWRQEGGRDRDPAGAAAAALTSAGRTVIVSGITVAVGFLALLLVRADFLTPVALGGALVVITSVAAALTLLPALLILLGHRIDWVPHLRGRRATETPGRVTFWGRWARTVMRRPWFFAAVAAGAIAGVAVPVVRLSPWNIGAKDLDPSMEAHRGYAILATQFERGWLGPAALMASARGDARVWDPGARDALVRIGDRLADDPRVALVLGFPRLVEALGPLASHVRSDKDLPEPVRPLAGGAVGAGGRAALLMLVTRDAPESREAMDLVSDLRRCTWPEAEAAGLEIRVGGASAVMADFDAALFGGLWQVVPAVLFLTFAALLVHFRSLIIPLKATILNLLSVLAAYGVLVLIFQEGTGASWLGIDPPGGVNSFVVLMLFPVLFGLSMDYEVFLLSRIREEYVRSGDHAASVARGLQRTGGVITSAALIMVGLFGSFAFTRLTATQEFGVGLAVAVALDATLIRLVLVPALMELFGPANWWLPTWLRVWIPPTETPKSAEPLVDA